MLTLVTKAAETMGSKRGIEARIVANDHFGTRFEG